MTETTTLSVYCPRSCPQPRQTYSPTTQKVLELNHDPDAILDWLFNGYTECAYCEEDLELAFPAVTAYSGP